MDVNGLCFTDEFRMRSPVVWLCFAIVVLCALSVESKRSYHIVHGQPGPIFRGVIPTIGYANVGVGPQFVGRRQQRQDEDEYDEVIDVDDEDEDEDEEDPPAYTGSYSGGYGGPQTDYEDEDEDDEEDEGEEDTDNEEFGERNVVVDEVIEGRQAYINNHYIEDPYVQRQRPQYNRVPVRTSTRKPTKTKPTKQSSHKKKPSHSHKRKPTAPLAELKPESALPPKRKEPEGIVTISPLSVLQPSSDKQKLQLRPVAMSTQFIATPVADLILRLSISLAKPVGQGNTTFNVPIRIHHSAGKTVEDSKVIRADLDLSRTDSMSHAVTVPSADKHPLEDDADIDDADEKEQTAEVPATELSRK